MKVLQGDLPQQAEGDLQQHTRRGRQTLIATPVTWHLTLLQGRLRLKKPTMVVSSSIMQ